MSINKESESRTVKQLITHNQKDWVDYFNKKKVKMISVPDTCETAKENNTKIITSLQKDFKEHILITSSRLNFSKDTLEGEVIHDAGSVVVTPQSIKLSEIPFYNNTKLLGVLSTDSGLSFLKALTQLATKGEIIEALKTLSGRDVNHIYVWTPSQSSRANNSVRSVVLYYYYWDGYFRLDCCDWYDCISNDGVSRRVTISPAKQAISKESDSQ